MKKNILLILLPLSICLLSISGCGFQGIIFEKIIENFDFDPELNCHILTVCKEKDKDIFSLILIKKPKEEQSNCLSEYQENFILRYEKNISYNKRFKVWILDKKYKIHIVSIKKDETIGVWFDNLEGSSKLMILKIK